MKQFFHNRWEDLQDYLGGGVWVKALAVLITIYLLIALVVGMFWSREPEMFDVQANALAMVNANKRELVTGDTSTATLLRLVDTLLDKQGGYVSNDIFPPGVWLDNISNWEFGVLVTVRDYARVLRKEISRSQSQSAEDKDLTIAEPQFNFDNDSWAIPATETEYGRGRAAIKRYMDRLADPAKKDAQFYARADNLRAWLSDVETRLGSLSKRLSESVGKKQMNTALQGERAAKQSTETPSFEEIQTPWLKIDDVFYEARGTAWALSHLLRAAEVDFGEVLRDKNALVSLQQIIIELEAAQDTMWSPMVLNGSGFGFVANHSLTMVSYISRTNAAIIDLRNLLSQG